MALIAPNNISEQLINSEVIKKAIMLGKESSLLHALSAGELSSAQVVVKGHVSVPRCNISFALDPTPDYVVTDADQIDGIEKEIILDSDVCETRFIKIPFRVNNYALATAYTGIDIEGTIARMAQIDISSRLDRDFVESMTTGAFGGMPLTAQNQITYFNKPSLHRLFVSKQVNYTQENYALDNTIQDIVNRVDAAFGMENINAMLGIAEGWYRSTTEQPIQAPDLFMGGQTYNKGHILILHPLTWAQLKRDPAFQSLYIARGVIQAGAPQVLTGQSYKGMVEGVHIFVSNQLRWCQQTITNGVYAGRIVTWNLLLGSEAVHWYIKEDPTVVVNTENDIKMDERLRLKIQAMYGMKSGQVKSIKGNVQRFDYGVVHGFSLV